jgi:hypothetical protein
MGVREMAYRKLWKNWRYQHCKDIGVDDDYYILYYKYKDSGWTAVGTCHPSVIPFIKENGPKAAAEEGLIRLKASAR